MKRPIDVSKPTKKDIIKSVEKCKLSKAVAHKIIVQPSQLTIEVLSLDHLDYQWVYKLDVEDQYSSAKSRCGYKEYSFEQNW